MKYDMAKFCRNVESGKMDRRELIQSLGFTATAALAASAVPRSVAAFAGGVAWAAAAEDRVFPVTHVNHLSMAVADYGKSRDFYVDLFGMRVVWDDGKGVALEFGDIKSPNGVFIRNVSKPGDKATINHIAYSLSDFMTYKAPMKAELERRKLGHIRPDGEVGWICDDPAGYMLNIVPIKDKAMYPGAAEPCEVASSAACKKGWESGLKNLNMAPKPSEKGFKALAYSYVVLNVPAADIAKETDFYRDMMAMKVIHTKAGRNPESFLRFGQNTLYLRPTEEPDDKPHCEQYSFVIENYDHAKVKAELERRGLNPKPDTKMAWMFTDMDGFKVGVAPRGVPEHTA